MAQQKEYRPRFAGTNEEQIRFGTKTLDLSGGIPGQALVLNPDGQTIELAGASSGGSGSFNGDASNVPYAPQIPTEWNVPLQIYNNFYTDAIPYHLGASFAGAASNALFLDSTTGEPHWLVMDSSYPNQALGYQFAAPYLIHSLAFVIGYRPASQHWHTDYTPTSFALDYSDDGSLWTELEAFSTTSFQPYLPYASMGFTVTQTHQPRAWWRIRALDVSSSRKYAFFGGIQFNVAEIASNLTVEDGLNQLRQDVIVLENSVGDANVVPYTVNNAQDWLTTAGFSGQKEVGIPIYSTSNHSGTALNILSPNDDANSSDWLSGRTSEHWWGYQYDTPIEIGRIGFMPGWSNGTWRVPHRTKSLAIQYSDDGTNWTEVQRWNLVEEHPVVLENELWLLDITAPSPGAHLYWRQYTDESNEGTSLGNQHTYVRGAQFFSLFIDTPNTVASGLDTLANKNPSNTIFEPTSPSSWYVGALDEYGKGITGTPIFSTANHTGTGANVFLNGAIDQNTHWLAGRSNDNFVGYKYAYPELIGGVTLYLPNNSTHYNNHRPYGIRIQGRNDDADPWVTVSEFDYITWNDSTGAIKDFDFDSTIAYMQWRIWFFRDPFYGTSSPHVWLAGVQFHKPNPVPSTLEMAINRSAAYIQENATYLDTNVNWSNNSTQHPVQNNYEGATITASSELNSGWIVENATGVNGTNSSPSWHSASTGVPFWIEYDYGTSVKVVGFRWIVATNNGGWGTTHFPQDFEVQHSDDGTNWTTVQRWVGQPVPPRDGTTFVFYAVESTSFHRYWRIYITRTGSSFAQIGGFQFDTGNPGTVPVSVVSATQQLASRVKAIEAREDIAVFTFPTIAQVGDNPIRIYNPTNTTRVITGVFIYCGVAPAGNTLDIRLIQDGTSFYTAQVPALAQEFSHTFSGFGIYWNIGSYLQSAIDQVGSVTSGAFITVHIKHRMA